MKSGIDQEHIRKNSSMTEPGLKNQMIICDTISKHVAKRTRSIGKKLALIACKK